MKSHRSRVAGSVERHPVFGLTKRVFWGAIGGIFWGLLNSGVHGQTPGVGAQQTALGIQQQTERLNAARDVKSPNAAEGDAAPETYPGESADLGPQMLLKKKKRPPLFEAGADTSILWTNNALFANWKDVGRETAIFNEVASLALTPEALEIGPGKLSLRTGYTHVFSVYDLDNRKRPGGASVPLNTFNFQVSTFFAGARYNFAENWNAAFRVDYTRILARRTTAEKWRSQRLIGPVSYWQESVVNISPTWSLERGFSLTEKVGLSIGYTGVYHFTEMDSPMSPADPRNRGNLLDRLETAISANVSCAVTQTFSVNPGIRLAHGLFTRTQSVSEKGERRRTFTASPSLIFLWAPKPYLSTRLGFSADFFRSNDADQVSYNKFDVSSGLSVTLKF